MGNLLFIGLTGGEPFLRKDLVDIVKIYYKNTKPLTISIPTNGILTKKILSDTEQMLKDCPKTNISIRFSLDGTEKIHDNIRGKKGIFKLMMRSYKSLNKLKNKYKNLNIGFVTVISTANQNNLDELFNFTKDKLNDNLWFILLARGDVKDKQLKKVDVKLYNDFTKRVSFLLNKKSSFLSNLLDTKDQLTYELVAKTTIENKYQIPCYAGKTSCIITENGEINPCETLDYTFGNIRDFDYNFKKLWNTKKAKTFRKNIGKCFCSHECWIANNILFNFKTWPKILKSMRK